MGQERGLKYMRDLAKQQPSPREGHELLAQLVAAGEGLMDVNIPIASVERMKERGAPIDWAAVGTAPAIMVGAGLSSQAAHPNAAKVFMEFILSREGQRLMRTPGRLVARADLAPEQADLIKEVKIAPVNPALAEKLGEYAKQLRSILGN
jgi:iron(III) transport system substrate-binding protein